MWWEKLQIHLKVLVLVILEPGSLRLLDRNSATQPWSNRGLMNEKQSGQRVRIFPRFQLKVVSPPPLILHLPQCSLFQLEYHIWLRGHSQSTYAGPGKRIKTWSGNLVQTNQIFNPCSIQRSIILLNYIIFAQSLVRTSPDVCI